MIRVFPRQTKWTPTDELAFIGDPPLIRPPDQPVRISATFTWDKIEAERLYRSWSALYSDVKIGGPAYDNPGGEFEPGRFVKEGVTITSRGCPKQCPFCFVPRREGIIRELPIKDGWIVQDNNLLACSNEHVEKVFDMLRRQSKAICFNGGLDATFFTERHRGLLDSIRLREAWFSCDRPNDLPEMERLSRKLENISTNKKRCFVLIGYEDRSPEEAEKRCQQVYELGFLPFAQLYRNERPMKYSTEWRSVARKWSRPAAYRSKKMAKWQSQKAGVVQE